MARIAGWIKAAKYGWQKGDVTVNIGPRRKNGKIQSWWLTIAGSGKRRIKVKQYKILAQALEDARRYMKKH